MRRVILEMPNTVHRLILRHLLPPTCRVEKAGFTYMRVVICKSKLILRHLEWDPIPTDEILGDAKFSLEITDQARARVIKRAYDLDASLVEWHSHPGSFVAAFSMTDEIEFKEFVPHVWWRTNGKPYAAVVVAPSGFDALAWIDNPNTYQQVSGIQMKNRVLRPSGLTLLRSGRYYV